MMYKDWFKYWFNSHQYFLIYKNRNEEEARQFFNLIERNIPLQRQWRILDFCCGYGRLAKIFSREGYNITGIDLSEFFINEAKKMFREENLQGEFKICDVRNFKEKDAYELGINFFTSFGYFSEEENLLTFKNLCESIVKNGWVVIDYFNPDFVINNLVEKEKFEFESSEILIERKIENERVNKIIVIKTNDRVEKYFESIRIYELDDFKNMFERNGFTTVKVFGDYAGNSFDSNSPRMIIFSQKQ